ncbi:MAG TPA: DNA polymerase Y family protein [Rhodocyclaceae bacterium]|nr:DNA polymerase Y family protein [Rhodocyclaceae bacterium]
MLWLALTFPKLPLEAQSERAAARQTVAGALVVEHGHVCVVDDVAAAAGVMPGMRFSTARSILPEGRVVERDAAAITREQAALDALACFAGSVTPQVCIDPPATLLLEIGGCLRLFGSLAAIVDYLARGCAERGFVTQIGVAPTPRGAQWLAQLAAALPVSPAALPASSAAAPAVPLVGAAGSVIDPRACCLTLEALPDMLADLPLGVLAARPEIISRLQAFGARSIGDLMALPRGGLARRVGPEVVAQLLQAVGELPDPRAPVVFPEYFRHRVELPAPASDAAMLGFPARRLIADLCGWLAARQAGAARCTLLFTPEQRGLPVQRLELRLATASRDPARFQRLLRERLDHTALAAPVGEIALEAGAPGEVVPLPGHNASLLDTRQPAAPLEVLLERLRARLGEDAVHGLCIHPDHRPECVTRQAAVGFAAAGGASAGLRPLNLLDPPEPLSEVDGRPARRGEPLELLSGPERIESGWWDQGERRDRRAPDGGRGLAGTGAWAGVGERTDFDAAGDPGDGGDGGNPGAVTCGAGGTRGATGGRPAPGDVRRDYFLARSRQGECWWIFRDAAGWWAQGVGFFAA